MLVRILERLKPAFGLILDHATRAPTPLESFPITTPDAGFVFVSHVMDSKGKPQASIRLLTGPLNERTEFDSFVFDEHSASPAV
jgi:hypothetical protein